MPRVDNERRAFIIECVEDNLRREQDSFSLDTKELSDLLADSDDDRKEIETLREGLCSIANCQSHIGRADIRKFAGEVLRGNITPMTDQSANVATITRLTAENERLQRAHDDRTVWMDAHVARIEELMATETRLTAERDEAIANCAAKDRVISGATQMEDNYRARIADLEAQLGKANSDYAIILSAMENLSLSADEMLIQTRTKMATMKEQVEIAARAPVKQEG